MSKSFFAIMLTSAIGTAALLSVAAPAQVLRNHDSNAPVDFDAGAIELMDRADHGLLTGGGTASLAGRTRPARRQQRAPTSPCWLDLYRLEADGGV